MVNHIICLVYNVLGASSSYIKKCVKMSQGVIAVDYLG